jgi:hypothetical protein
MIDLSTDLAYGLDAVAWARSLGFDADEAQARLLRSRSKRGILNCTRQWGKSTTTAAKALHHGLYHPGSLCVVVSPGERQSAEWLRKVEGFAQRLGVRPKGDGDNAVSLLLPNGSRIVGLPGTDKTTRGFSAVSLLLIDEAARVPDTVYKSVRPFLAVGGGALWLLSTPFGKRGFFWEEWEKGGELWERIRVPATECARIAPEFLDEERASQGDWWFRQEYLCEFVDVSNSAFSHDAILRAVTDEVEPLCL